MILEEIPMPRRNGLRMCAASGTENQNLVRKVLPFHGVKAGTSRSIDGVRPEGVRRA